LFLLSSQTCFFCHPGLDPISANLEAHLPFPFAAPSCVEALQVGGVHGSSS
jgi:hypothetical protein